MGTGSLVGPPVGTMRILIAILISFFTFALNAQERLSVVTLKNGTELKGIIKSIDPTDALTLTIATVDTKIEMSDVARVEETTSYYPNSTRMLIIKPKMDTDTPYYIQQSDFVQENTIYVIPYDFTIDPREVEGISVPANCVLKFEGGSLNKGTLRFNNTTIDSDGKCFSDITFGNFSIANKEALVTWIDYSNMTMLQRLIDGCSSKDVKINLCNRVVNVTQTLYIDRPVGLDNICDMKICNGTFNLYTDYLFDSRLKGTFGSQCVIFEELTFKNGKKDASWVLKDNRFIRIKFAYCNFNNVCLLNTDKILQGYKLFSCKIWNLSQRGSTFIRVNNEFHGLKWEHCDLGYSPNAIAIDIDSPCGCVIQDSGIEGCKMAIKCRLPQGFTITNNYFENCADGIFYQEVDKRGAVGRGLTFTGNRLVAMSRNENYCVCILRPNVNVGTKDKPDWRYFALRFGNLISATVKDNFFNLNTDHKVPVYGTYTQVKDVYGYEAYFDGLRTSIDYRPSDPTGEYDNDLSNYHGEGQIPIIRNLVGKENLNSTKPGVSAIFFPKTDNLTFGDRSKNGYPVLNGHSRSMIKYFDGSWWHSPGRYRDALIEATMLVKAPNYFPITYKKMYNGSDFSGWVRDVQMIDSNYGADWTKAGESDWDEFHKWTLRPATDDASHLTVYVGGAAPWRTLDGREDREKHGSGKSNRPIFTVPDDNWGYLYMDNSFNPAKPIYWAGSYWVDGAGNRITWPITYKLKNISTSNKQTPDVNSSYTTILSAEKGYSLPSNITVIMGGRALETGYTYSKTTGVLTIDSVTGAIEVIASP